jgi:hypothetical protein
MFGGGGKVHRYWFRFAVRIEDDPPSGVLLGCGVTALDRADAEALIEERVFGAGRLPPVVEVVEDVEVTALDPGHVQPNMGDTVRRGVWFPLGHYAPRPAVAGGRGRSAPGGVRRIRWLSVKELAVCAVGGAMAGLLFRPRTARIPQTFLPDDEVVPTILCAAGGAAAVLGGYILLVWRKGW